MKKYNWKYIIGLTLILVSFFLLIKVVAGYESSVPLRASYKTVVSNGTVYRLSPELMMDNGEVLYVITTPDNEHYIMIRNVSGDLKDIYKIPKGSVFTD